MVLEGKIRTSSSELSMIDKQIINCKIVDDSNFYRNDVLEIRAANKILSNGKEYCVLFEVGRHVDLTKSAREASVEPEHYENRIALALLHNNFAMKMIADFYIKIYNPPPLTKNFSNREKAIAWLKEMRDDFYSKK